jgi:TonB family protein
MSEAVTDVIVSRSREPQGLKTMIVCSTAAHVVAVAVLALMPRSDASEPERVVMTISLGAAGPETSGMTAMGGREVQAVKPPEPVRRPETAPASRRDEMTLPSPRTKPDNRPERSNTTSPNRTPSVGDEITEGNTRANTRQRNQGFGLAGGGAAEGSGVKVDVQNFCCPAYLETMVAVIKRNWSDDQGRVASTTIKFTIARNGGILDPQVEIASGFTDLDSLALRAVSLAKLPQLPVEFTNPTLTVHVRFDYER